MSLCTHQNTGVTLTTGRVYCLDCGLYLPHAPAPGAAPSAPLQRSTGSASASPAPTLPRAPATHL